MLKRRSTWRTLPSKMKKMRYTIYTLNSSIFKIPVYLRAVEQGHRRRILVDGEEIGLTYGDSPPAVVAAGCVDLGERISVHGVERV